MYSKIVEKPTLLEILSFTFYYPSSVIGPSFEFKDFRAFIRKEGVYSRIPYKITFLYGGFYFVLSFICMIFYGGLVPKFPVSLVGKVEYRQYSLLYRLVYLNVSMMLHRFKFYCGWLLSYSGMILCGLAYNEVDEKVIQSNIAVPHADLGNAPNGLKIVFDKGEYGSIVDCEFGLNPKTKITSWNRTVHLWLKYNLFLRMINIERKPFKNNFSLASLATFMLSALWHGFYPTYYIFFFLFYIFQSANEAFDKLNFFIWIRQQNYLYKVLMFLFSQSLCNSLGAIIFNLRWRLFKMLLKNVYYFQVIMVFALFGLSKVAPMLKKKFIKSSEHAVKKEEKQE